MKIIRLEAENIKCLKAVEITPEGNVVVVGGQNGAGKTSVLDSIMYALAGGKAVCEKPLRAGQKRGKATVALDNGLVATRTFTAGGGGSLTVTNADGAKFTSPQAILDKITGTLTFDPLAFIRMEPREQLETLRSLVGLDFSDMDAKRKEFYEKRTIVNRDVRTLEAQVAGMHEYTDLPAEEMSIAELSEKLREAQATNNRNAAARRDVEQGLFAVEQLESKLQDIEEQIATWQAAKKRMEAEITQAQEKLKEEHRQVEQLSDIDVDVLHAQIEEAEGINLRIRKNQAREQAMARLAELKKESSSQTAEIERIDQAKAGQLWATKFPVQGLSFDENAVLFQKIPFDQASSAEQLRVSVAMAAAMNPELRVMLIRDGSLLDQDSFRMLSEFAAKNDCQIWLERVGEGQECQVIIRDGQVAERRSPAQDSNDETN